MPDLFGIVYPVAWFLWDMCNNMIILWKTRKWVKGSVTDTTAQVTATLLKPETTEPLKKALNIPDRGEIEALKNQIRQIDLSFQAALDARLAGVIKDVTAAVKAEIVPLNPDLIGEQVGKSITAYMKNQMSQRSKELAAAKEDFINQYKASPEAARDAQMIYKILVERFRVAPGLAEWAVKTGGTAIEWAVEYSVGEKEAKEIFDAFSKARTLAPPISLLRGA